jgi:hypothetical protein
MAIYNSPDWFSNITRVETLYTTKFKAYPWPTDFSTHVYVAGVMRQTVPHKISDERVQFYLRGKIYEIEASNPNFEIMKTLMRTGILDEARYILLADPSLLDLSGTGGRLVLEGGQLVLDGKVLDRKWTRSILDNPLLIQVLLAKVGDRVVVQGDEDAPDGEYPVMAIDETDLLQRIYLETEDGFFGYVKSSAIREVRCAHD